MKIDKIQTTAHYPQFKAGKVRVFSDFDKTFLPSSHGNFVHNYDERFVNAIRKNFKSFKEFLDNTRQGLKFTITTGRTFGEFQTMAEVSRERKFGMPLPDTLIVKNGSDEHIRVGTDEDFYNGGEFPFKYEVTNKEKEENIKKLTNWDGPLIKEKLKELFKSYNMRIVEGDSEHSPGDYGSRSLFAPGKLPYETNKVFQGADKADWSVGFRNDGNCKIFYTYPYDMYCVDERYAANMDLQTKIHKIFQDNNIKYSWAYSRGEHENECGGRPWKIYEPDIIDSEFKGNHDCGLSKVYDVNEAIKLAQANNDLVIAAGDSSNDAYMLNPGVYLKNYLTDEILNKTFTNNTGENVKRYYKTNDGKLHDCKKDEDFEFVTGRYIVERYLLDDLYETDKVELRYNQSNFLVGKMLPVSFEKMCTMGTAAIWKYIMLAWSYEHDLAIPELINSHPFTGGLSRLLKVGYVDRIVKLDFNSLYPSIILSFNIKTPVDIMGVMNAILEYILTEREHFKELKGEFGAKAKKVKKQIETNPNAENIEELKIEQAKCETEAARNDKMQLPLKITGNAFFGSYGSGSVFPWSDLVCAEETTCTGRMMLRLMISHFTRLGYEPIVGDSFTEDTPVFIKYNKTNDIDILPISKLINEDNIKIDKLGREYDTSKKDFKVLCRSGWKEASYIYRHKTDKDIYEIKDNSMVVEVTEDHSLFNDKQEKIKPSEITNETKLEYYNGGNIVSNKYELDKRKINMCAVFAAGNREHASVTKDILNSTVSCKKLFLEKFERYRQPNKVYSKQIMASLQYLKMCVGE